MIITSLQRLQKTVHNERRVFINVQTTLRSFESVKNQVID